MTELLVTNVLIIVQTWTCHRLTPAATWPRLLRRGSSGPCPVYFGNVRKHWTFNVERSPFAFLLLVLSAISASASPSTLPLQLHDEGRHTDAAIEYRRLALDTAVPDDQAGWFWCAADEYRQAGTTALAESMLSRADNASMRVQHEALLLRGELAMQEGNWSQADFYFQTSAPAPAAADGSAAGWRRYAAGRSAVARLEAGNLEGARQALAGVPGACTNAFAALDRYAAAPRKKPWVGGLLGLVPGLGYVYSGEYANGARSLILNGLFIFGMAATAERDQWGGFAAISFFEVTWYSGSIYGGIDAAHRYNDANLGACAAGVMEGASFTPDRARLPLISLQFKF